MIYLRTRYYGKWFFVNFGLCGIPFIIMLLVGYAQSNIFSSFLTFNYTLLVSSLYLLMQALNRKKERMKVPDFLIYLTVFWLIIVIVLFALYPRTLNVAVQNWFSSGNLSITYIIIISLTITISLFLNMPQIEDNIKETHFDTKHEKSKKEKEKIKNIKNEIEEKGL